MARNTGTSPRDAIELHLVVHGDDGVGGNERIQRLAQVAGWQRQRLRDVVAADQDDVDVAFELEVLEPVVQHVDRRAEAVLGQAAREVPIGRHEHRRAGQLPGEHERLVSRSRHVGAHAARIAHDDDAVSRLTPPVAAAEHRGRFPHLDQQPRDRRRRRRLAAPPDREVAHADHRPAQPAAQVRPRGISLAAAAHDGGV